MKIILLWREKRDTWQKRKMNIYKKIKRVFEPIERQDNPILRDEKAFEPIISSNLPDDSSFQ